MNANNEVLNNLRIYEYQQKIMVQAIVMTGILTVFRKKAIS